MPTPSPSLIVGVLSTRWGEARLLGSGRSRGGAQFSFGARVSHRVRWELSRLLNSQAGRQAARGGAGLGRAARRGGRGWRELAGTIGAAEAAGLNGCWRDHTCQTAIRILRATADLAA